MFSDSNDQRYAYEALGDNEIRLIHLLPGSFNAPIRCQLGIASLSSAGDYEALSYAWGDPLDTVPITIEDDSDQSSSSLRCEKTLYVTISLETALRYLRREQEERVLWADAICIDQQNVKERENQIRKMRDIYKLARSVLVWLGLGDSEIMWFMDTILKVDVEDERVRDWIDLRSLYAFLSLLKLSWWERKWTVQEFTIAQSPPIVGYGTIWVPWPKLFEAGHQMDTFGRAMFTEHREYVDMRSSWRTLWSDRARQLNRLRYQHCSSAIPLHLALRMTRRNACTEPRDAVFSLLGLVDVQYASLADYSKTVREIFIKTTRLIIEKEQCLDILGLESPHTKFPDLPSWVPDYSSRMPNNSARTINYQNGKDSDYWASDLVAKMSPLSSSLPDVLRVEAVEIDMISITQSMDSLTEPQTLFASLCALERLINNCIECGIYQNLDRMNEEYGPRSRTTCESFFRVLSLRNAPMGFEFMGRMPKLHTYIARIRRGEEFDILDAEVEYLLPAMINIAQGFHGRSFFVSSPSGFFGIGPQQMKEGDLLTILRGANVPFVLRAAGETQYKVVGESYVHGVMQGEWLDYLKAVGSGDVPWIELDLI